MSLAFEQEIEKEFDLGDYIESKRIQISSNDITKKDVNQFMKMADDIKAYLDSLEKEDTDNLDEKAMALSMERQKQALLGESREVEYYKNKIREAINEKGYSGAWYPSWYTSLEDGIFNEAYGFAGLTQWIRGDTPELAESSSCKTIGDRIYFRIKGKLQLQPQRISVERRRALKEALLLTDPRKNRAAPYFEVYLNDGSRVTIFNDNGVAKKGQDTIVFRKYHVNVYSFEEQAERKTIPKEAIPMFKNMIKCGYNVAFTGPVCSAKTTMLTTWQSYEDSTLEGLLIETDPEIPMHEIMPDAPIMQLVPTEENLNFVITQAKRSDAAYVVIGEAREGKVLNVVVEAANMGTYRCKVTFHNTESVDFCYDVADKITKDVGGELGANMIKVAKSINYVFNMCYLPSNPDEKRLNSIWEVRYDNEKVEITMHQICKYNYDTDDWVWAYDIGPDKENIGKIQNKEAFLQFDSQLEMLAKKYPNKDQYVFVPPYIKVLGIGGEK